MINKHKTEESKIQLKMYIYFISSKDTGEILMYGVTTKKLDGAVKPMILLINVLNLFQITTKKKSK